MAIDTRTGKMESDDKLHPVAENIVGAIQSQLKAGHVQVDELPAILESVVKHVREVYRPRERQDQRHDLGAEGQ